MNKSSRMLKNNVWNESERLHSLYRENNERFRTFPKDLIESLCSGYDSLLKSSNNSRERKAIIRKVYNMWYTFTILYHRRHIGDRFFDIVYDNRNALSTNNREIVMEHHFDLLKMMADKMYSNSFYKPIGSTTFPMDLGHSLFNPLVSNTRECIKNRINKEFLFDLFNGS